LLCSLGLGRNWDTRTSYTRQPVPLSKQGKAAFPTRAAPAGTQLMSPTLLQNPPRLLWCQVEPRLPPAPTLGTPGGSAALAPKGGGFPSPPPSLQPSLPFPSTAKSQGAGNLHPSSPVPFCPLWFFCLFFPPLAVGKLWDTKKHRPAFYRGITKA